MPRNDETRKMNLLKQQLFNKCIDYINQKSEVITKAMSDSKDAANNETKSTAGDKHETSRASMHLEQETLSGQLTEVDKLHEAMQKLKHNLSNTKTITSGSLVISSAGNFYISISAGKIVIDDKEYFAISTNSPIGALLLGKKEKEVISFNNKQIKIEKIY